MSDSSMAASQGRQIRVRQATPADAIALADIHFDAFSTGPMQGLLNPGGLTEDAKAKFAASLFPAPQQQPGGNVGERFVYIAELIREGEEPEPVGLATWKVFRTERSREEWDVKEQPLTEEMLGKGSDPEVYHAFIGRMHGMRSQWIGGQKHLHLGILACTTKYHRLGAGNMLISRGLELADAEGLPTFLEGTPAGYKLYRRKGFENIGVFDMELTKRWGLERRPDEDWGQDMGADQYGRGAEGCLRTIGMRRPPKSA